MKISGSVASYSLRRCSTCRGDDVEERQPAAHAQQRLRAVHAHRRAEPAVELDHRGRADRGRGVLVGHLDVGAATPCRRARSPTPGSSRSRRAPAAGSSARTSRWRPRRRPRRRILSRARFNPALPMLSIVGFPRGPTAHASDPDPAPGLPGAGPPSWRCATSCSPPVSRGPLVEIGRGRAGDRRHLLAHPGGTPRGHGRGVRLARPASPAPAVLLDALRRAGKRVILPVLLPDDDLDWARLPGPDGAGRRPAAGCSSPPASGSASTRSRPPTSCSCPASRSSPTGMRLGRGGGSYDRALARVPVGTFTCVLLYDDEVGVDVPVEPHDRPVRGGGHPVRGQPARA